MNLDELAAYREAHVTRSIYRQESLDVYTVDSDADNVRRYLAGLHRNCDVDVYCQRHLGGPGRRG